MPPLPLHDEAVPPLAALVVDADPASIRQFRAVLEEHPGIVIAATAHTVAQALRQTAKRKPDVVFLDVAIANGKGLTLASHFDHEQVIVVVTDRPDYAVAAFQVGAIDYLLKPLSSERLGETLRRLDRLFPRHAAQTQGESQPFPSRPASSNRIPLASRPSGRRTTELVPVESVLWVESLQNYSIVQLPGHDRRQMKRTLTEWEGILPAQTFVRIGRSHLVQIAKIRAIESSSRNEWLVHFHDTDTPLRLGRAAASKLKGIVRGSYPA